jgi:L-threonylcarbamoyladenylate synthase
VKRLPVSPESIAEAAEVLRNGGIVAYPTETVYGLAVDPFSEEALRAVMQAKGRPETNPILCVIAGAPQLETLVGEVTPEARHCMDRFWPGPLSLVLPRKAGVPDLLTAGTERVCVRCPDHETARALCTAFGGPITSTSANLSGEPPVSTLDDLMLDGIALALDAGPLPPSLPSTVYDPDSGQVLREGAIAAADLASRLTPPHTPDRGSGTESPRRHGNRR